MYAYLVPNQTHRQKYIEKWSNKEQLHGKKQTFDGTCGLERGVTFTREITRQNTKCLSDNSKKTGKQSCCFYALWIIH